MDSSFFFLFYSKSSADVPHPNTLISPAALQLLCFVSAPAGSPYVEVSADTVSSPPALPVHAGLGAARPVPGRARCHPAEHSIASPRAAGTPCTVSDVLSAAPNVPFPFPFHSFARAVPELSPLSIHFPSTFQGCVNHF